MACSHLPTVRCQECAPYYELPRISTPLTPGFATMITTERLHVDGQFYSADDVRSLLRRVSELEANADDADVHAKLDRLAFMVEALHREVSPSEG